MNEQPWFLDRQTLAAFLPNSAAVRQFEDLQQQVADTGEKVLAGVDATDALAQATFLTLSPNRELQNERVLSLGRGLDFDLSDGNVTIYSLGAVVASGRVTMVSEGEALVTVPLTGTLATREVEETLERKTLAAPRLSGLVDAADDAGAAAGNVPIGGVYRNGSVLMVRTA